ncbi:MAG: carcinine hydrolase/isopenicillin-N N-acyltransferase family protein [archaeon]|nr:carcinine hydrolase/isopenicillin-N N-acyltransferase family protein [archaeon]
MDNNTSTGKGRIAMAIVALVVCVIAVSASAVTVLTSEEQGQTTFSLRQCTASGLYYLDMTGDDHFAEYKDVGSSDMASFRQFLQDKVTCGEKPRGPIFGNCSVFMTEDSVDGGYLVGRNFDYNYPNTCVVFNSGEGIYSSVSTVDLAMFCDVDESFMNMTQDTRLNAVTYLPLDGINEKGVFIAINSVNNGKAFQQTREGHVGMFVTTALRLALDYADSAEKAVELISDLNLFSPKDFHIFTCDNSGKGYTIEVVGDTTYVTETDLLTNHYLTPAGADTPVSESSRFRFGTLQAAMDENPTMDKTQVRDALASVKQENPDKVHYTRWSVVYDLEDLTATIFLRKNGEMNYEHGDSYDIHDVTC